MEQIIRTTFWTRHDQTIRDDEIEEELELQEADEEERRKRLDSFKERSESLRPKDKGDTVQLKDLRHDQVKMVDEKARKKVFNIFL